MKLVDYLLDAFSHDRGGYTYVSCHNNSIYLSTALFQNDSDVVMDIPLPIYRRAGIINLQHCAREKSIIKQGVETVIDYIDSKGTLSDLVRQARYTGALGTAKVGDSVFHFNATMLLDENFKPLFLPFIRAVFTDYDSTGYQEATFKPGLFIARKIMEGKKGLFGSMKNNMAIPAMSAEAWFRNISSNEYEQSRIFAIIGDDTPLLDMPVDMCVHDAATLNCELQEIAENELA
jgi:hypothetical protein